MAGATNSYKIWVDADGKLQKKLVSHSPKYAVKPKTAVDLVRSSGTVYLAPGDWMAFEAEWNKQS